MSYALPATDLATATTYLEGAVDVTLRSRPFMGWLDKAGRIRRDATGKDYNWKIKYKNTQANPYTPGQQINFNNENFYTSASVTPEWFFTSSGMDITDELMNSGSSAIINNYQQRVQELAAAMEIYIAKAIFADAATAAGANRLIGLGTICKKSLTIATANTDRIAPPIAGTGIYAGVDLSLGSQGGSWSSNAAVKMNVALGTDWPDGQGDPSNAYDGTSPRLYNENTNRWASLTATAANSDWRTNCIAMLSRANTDLKQNSVASMMPNIHMSGSERYQAIKDLLRTSFRDTAHVASENLGYYDTLAFEGALIDLEHECPADRTYSINGESMELYFYGMPNDSKARAMGGMSENAQRITGGIYATYGPERPAGSLQTVWLMFAGGNTRFQPKWVVCHKDWTV